jgi:hypothetical protein
MTEDGHHLSQSMMYVCPFSNSCECPLKFRVETAENDFFIYTHGKHNIVVLLKLRPVNSRAAVRPSHKMLQCKLLFSRIPWHAALKSWHAALKSGAVFFCRTLRGETTLLPKNGMYTLNSAKVAKCATLFFRSTRMVGAQTKLKAVLRGCTRRYIAKLEVEHNQPGGEHLSLHNPVCVGYQFENGMSFASSSTLPAAALDARCKLGT